MKTNEIDVKKELMQLAEQNADVNHYACFLGAGAYNHWVPSTVDHITGRSEFYTAYTPYQPEVSQGTLQTIFEFQSWMCRLTGLDVANASLYDGATALAEAALMAMRLTRRNEIVLANEVHPAYLQVLNTYLEPHNAGIKDQVSGVGCQVSANEKTSAVIMQQPSFTGDVVSMKELQSLSDQAHEAGALFVVCIDPISLGVLPKPAEYGADIVVGEGQPMGMHLSYGGPYLGFITCREKYLRQMPGRIIGETVDTDGKRGYVLTMQTREQHIRREKATSNICSNEALCALAATVYLSLLGEAGLKEVAETCQQKADAMKEKLAAVNGVKVLNQGGGV
ncbi:aminomethyl-transferring glycine dehydrogenase subunit GcvPA [Candidatus Margulisiibacteriota bacterium]